MRPVVTSFTYLHHTHHDIKRRSLQKAPERASGTRKDRNCLVVVDNFLTIHPLMSYFQQKNANIWTPTLSNPCITCFCWTLQRATRLHSYCVLSEGHAKMWPHTIVLLFPVSMTSCPEVTVVYPTRLFTCKGCVWMCRCSMFQYIHVGICVLIDAWATKFEHRMFSYHSHSVSKITLRILGRKPWSKKHWVLEENSNSGLFPRICWSAWLHALWS